MIPVRGQAQVTDLTDPAHQKIQINIGETKAIPIEGEGAFSSDDTVFDMKELRPGEIVITGLGGGNAQLFYWKEGVLTYLAIEVLVAPTLQTTSIGPHFLGNRSYFLYQFQNNSSFSQKTFFQLPTYSHFLTGNIPLFANGGHLQSSFGFQHQGDQQGRIPAGSLVYQDRRRIFLYGQSSVSLSRLGAEAFSGASFLGSTMKFSSLQPSSNISHEFQIFGGVKQPQDLLKIKAEEPVYGLNYFLSRFIPDTLFPDFFNVSFLGYQPQPLENHRFYPAGLVEGNYHFDHALSLGTGFTMGKGGYTAVLSPALEKEGNLTSARYVYVHAGLQALQASIVENDEHRYRIQHQRLLGDHKTFLAASFAQEISLQKTGSQKPASDNLNSAFSFRRQFSFQKSYGFQYSFGRSHVSGVTALNNGLSTFLNYPLTQTSFVSHGVGYSRSDLSSSSQQVNFFTALTSESRHMRSSTLLDSSLVRGVSPNESLGLQENLQFSFSRGQLQMGFAYQKSNLRDGNHQLQWTPLFLYQVTNTHALTLNGSMSWVLGDIKQMNGGVGIGYRYFFGPGVERDSPLKLITRSVGRAPVEGDIFLDKNFDGYLNEGDEPLTDFPISLDGHETRTSSQGHFVFPKVKSGEHTLALNQENLEKAGIGNENEFDFVQKFNMTTDGREKRQVTVPVSFKKASLRVRLVMDVNGNGKVDGEDSSVSLPKIFFQNATSQPRKVVVIGGEARIRGLEKGEVTVSLDSLDFPENLDLFGSLEQKISVTDYQDYEIIFLFLPVRSIRGKIVVPETSLTQKPSSLLKKMSVKLGEVSSSVDAEGFYWLKKLPAGEYPLEVKNLPPSYCIDKVVPSVIKIPEGPYVQNFIIPLKTDCAESKEEIPGEEFP